MNIVVINGTQVRGCTYHIKEAFLYVLRESSDIKEFYLPKDMPHFCRGCKTCFLKDERLCPHADTVMPIWNAMMDADLIVFAYPVYALRTTGQIKALLDHLCVHWMVHRPEEAMFAKRAVLLTNAIGVFNGGAQKDVATSLTWMGVPDIKKLGIGLMEGVVWDELSVERRDLIVAKTQKLAQRYARPLRPARKGLKTGLMFCMVRAMHQSFAKKEDPLSADNRHWLNKGWIKL